MVVGKKYHKPKRKKRTRIMKNVKHVMRINSISFNRADMFNKVNWMTPYIRD